MARKNKIAMTENHKDFLQVWAAEMPNEKLHKKAQSLSFALK